MLQFMLYIDPAQMNNPKECAAQDKLYRLMKDAIDATPDEHRAAAYRLVLQQQTNAHIYLGKN